MRMRQRVVLGGTAVGVIVLASVLGVSLAGSAPSEGYDHAAVVGFERIPDSIRLRSGAAIWREIERRAGEWGQEMRIQHLPDDQIVRMMDDLDAAVLEASRSGESGWWMEVHELSQRQGLLCVELSPDHPYRGGNYCD